MCTRIRSTVAGIVALMSMLLTAQVLSAPAASAYTTTSTGRTGGVTPYQVIGTHFSVPCGYGGGSGCFQPGIILPGPVVSRTPGSTRAQTVYVVYTAFRWSNGWMRESTETLYQTIPAGYPSVRFPNRNWLLNTGGEKRVQYGVVWTNPRTGAVLGSKRVAMNQQGDYVCQTRFTFNCWAAAGYVTVREP